MSNITIDVKNDDMLGKKPNVLFFDEVEIIEKNKKIEKLEMFIPQRESDTYCTKYNEVASKINEIIDYINKGDKK